MTPRRLNRQGTRMLCEALRFIPDVNVEIAGDARAKPEDRKDAAATAKKAREDGLKWGCGWAERA